MKLQLILAGTLMSSAAYAGDVGVQKSEMDTQIDAEKQDALVECNELYNSDRSKLAKCRDGVETAAYHIKGFAKRAQSGYETFVSSVIAASKQKTCDGKVREAQTRLGSMFANSIDVFIDFETQYPEAKLFPSYDVIKQDTLNAIARGQATISKYTCSYE